MRVRRPQDLAVERAGGREISTVHCAPGHLWHPIRTDRPRSHPFEPCRRNIIHRSSPSSRCAVDLRLPRRSARSNQNRRHRDARRAPDVNIRISGEKPIVYGFTSLPVDDIVWQKVSCRGTIEDLMRAPVRKAVFPVAGLGTRFLPATKAMPKEMLPIVDKPLIHYAVEEAKAAGIEQFFFVTSRGKSAIDDHFDRAFELEATLRDRGKEDVLAELEARLPEPGQIAYTRQQTPLGLGHAVWCARELVGDEPFAVLLADDLMVCQ